MNKLEKYKLKIRTEIKETIFKILNKFDMSKYIINTSLYPNYCEITVCKDNLMICLIRYGKLHDIYSDFDIRVYGAGLFDIPIKGMHIKTFLQNINSEPVEIIKTLYDNEKILRQELINIIE